MLCSGHWLMLHIRKTLMFPVRLQYPHTPQLPHLFSECSPLTQSILFTQIFHLHYISCPCPSSSSACFPEAHWRQIAALVPKWPQQKDDDKRAVVSSVCPHISHHSNWLLLFCRMPASLVLLWPPQICSPAVSSKHAIRSYMIIYENFKRVVDLVFNLRTPEVHNGTGKQGVVDCICFNCALYIKMTWLDLSVNFVQN